MRSLTDRDTNSDSSSSDEDVPRNIGPYRILDVLGEGGMAVVYLAEQLEPVKRQVALKIVKLGMDSKQVVARFESERQALAVLEHPNIAKVFDGGISENGRPYFAMECVRGVPITEYCDTNRLSTHDRIRLFVDVCSAVQHAHHKGLIHRDLKPSNLLVGVIDEKPQVKVIDFGIAKATGKSFTDQTLYTKIGQIIGTPQYMSPEQADITGLDVDTRTDIYSLGVVLYEMLAGVLPLDLSAIADHAIKHALIERDPPRPSTRITELGDTKEEVAKARNTSPADLRKQLKGDLDWVVMHAIEKDRTRRYETANALGLECQRFLNHEPVLARPASAGYLLHRFVRRHRVTVLAASVALLAVLAGATAATVGFVRATAAEEAARVDARTAQQVSGFLVELFRLSDPSSSRGNSITAREILDRGAERIRSELTSEPRVQATLMGTMGSVYSSLGLYDAAQDLLDDAVLKAEETFGPDSLATSASVFALGELTRMQGDYSKAELLHRRALAIRESQLPEGHELIALCWEGLGMDLYFNGRYREAEDLLKRALDSHLANFGEEDARISRIYSNLGSVYHNLDRFEEAEEVLGNALRISRALYGELHPQVGSNYNDLALVYRETGRPAEAIEAFETCIEIYRQIYPDGHPFTSESQGHLAGVIGRMGDVPRAVELYEEAIAGLERTVGHEHVLTARVIDSYGVLLLSNRRYAEAEPIMQETLALHRQLVGTRHISTGRVANNMAALLFLQGEYERAEPFFRESLSIRLEHLGDENGDVANSRNNLADLLNRLGRYEEAEPLASAAATGYGNSLTPDHWRAAVARNIHGRSLAGLLRFDEAEALLAESANIISASVPGTVYHRMALERAAEVYELSGNPEQAEVYRQQLICVEQPSTCPP